MGVPTMNLTGHHYGRLVVLEIGPKFKGRHKKWLCRCDCGNEKYIYGHNLRHGHTQSCGCIRVEARTKHGKSGTPEYRSYTNMLARCYSLKYRDHKYYAGRGITVCERWRDSIAAFITDMGPRPSPQHTLDRIDNDGNYTPDNCRWATPTEQSRNRQNTKLSAGLVRELRAWVASGGNLAKWARDKGINISTATNAAAGRKWKNV